VRELEEFSVLVQPGLHGAGAGHWMTSWEQAFPTFRRVPQDDWEKPEYGEWSRRLGEEVGKAARPVILVAHSAGTSLVMRWSLENTEAARKVAGAFLVAPSDRDSFVSPAIRNFGGMILKPLPFRSMVVASRNDDRVSFGRAKLFASSWGSAFVDVGDCGHIGEAMKLGYWPFGLVQFGRFIASLPA